MIPHAGELAALAAAFCWTITAISFEAASVRIGALNVNLIRLPIAMIFLVAYSWIARGHALPLKVSAHAWFWLSISGVVGLFMGDLCLFEAFVLIGSRKSLLIMSLVPPLTAFMSWVFMGEWLSTLDWVGIGLTVAGISWVVFERGQNGSESPLKPPVFGITMALLASLGQAGGLVLSKVGMRDCGPFAATQIRVMAAVAGFGLVFTVFRWWPRVGRAIKNRAGMAWTTVGALLGTFMGIFLSLVAVKLTKAGIAATIMSISPILIIPPAIWLFKERINVRAVAGAMLAVVGVALLFL